MMCWMFPFWPSARATRTPENAAGTDPMHSQPTSLS